jgi:hypothetical protein
VNFRIKADQGNRVEEPEQGENIINSYVAHLRRIRDYKTLIEEKAVHLSWILHQLGDIHQPLHAVARFSQAFPHGDRGGNEVHFPNSSARGGRQYNLHTYWDDLLGTDSSPETVERLAAELMREYPARGFERELVRMEISDWAQESVALSLSVAYRNLDPNIKVFADKPIGYEADALKAARRRVTLAGYRLADELEQLFGSK